MRGASRGNPRARARRAPTRPRPTSRSGRLRSGGGCRDPWTDDRHATGRWHEPFGPSSTSGQPRYVDPMGGLLIVNPSSGDGGPEELLDAARQRDIETYVLRDGDDLAAIAREADADADVLAMAGGDGSLAVVAEAALERGVPFACIPFGTRNHFARDLGLDRDDPVAALDALVDGRELRIDVGRANDRLFLNNVSLGVYAHLVHRREHHRRRDDAFARMRALGTLVTHRRHVDVTID